MAVTLPGNLSFPVAIDNWEPPTIQVIIVKLDIIPAIAPCK